MSAIPTAGSWCWICGCIDNRSIRTRKTRTSINDDDDDDDDDDVVVVVDDDDGEVDGDDDSYYYYCYYCYYSYCYLSVLLQWWQRWYFGINRNGLSQSQNIIY